MLRGSSANALWFRCPPLQASACAFLVLLWIVILPSALARPENLDPKFFSVLASAQAQVSPPQLLLSWPADTNATGYAISRKLLGEATWTPLATLGGDATSFTDTSVQSGRRYEYQFIKTTADDYSGYGYLCAGIEAPLLDDRGKLVLIVANTFAPELDRELGRLQQDLVGDGWTVLRHDVDPSSGPADVKALIQTDYQADPDHVQAVFLFGAVPVPYSGALAPDGHTNHWGAWPADVYYATMQGEWTDSSVTATNAEETRNWNIPGDGKFDQSVPPGPVVLELGRVDLSRMTCFSNKTPSRSELDLLRQYLNKDHRFRFGLLPLPRRALICDNFSDKGDDPVAGSGWRNFSGFFGADQIVEVGWSNYFPSATSEGYLWSFASGGGQYYTCTGVGSSDDFALQDIKVVFTLWLGSHFGDWDNESNFLRAPLGSTSYTLLSCYAGFPQWLYHPMALGETAGYCARLTQNNRPGGLYPPFNQGTNQVHIALLGDPSLRMHPVLPPSGLALLATGGTVQVSWTASPDTSIRGYHVYRAPSPSGPFVRLTGDAPLSDLIFSDTSAPTGTLTYMVRAVKLETSSSGSYLNPSQGIFGSATVSTPPPGLALELRPAGPAQLQLGVTGAVGQSFRLESSSNCIEWNPFATNAIQTSPFQIPLVLPAGVPQQFYRAAQLP